MNGEPETQANSPGSSAAFEPATNRLNSRCAQPLMQRLRRKKGPMLTQEIGAGLTPKSTVTVCPILPASNRATHYRHQPYATCAPACCGGSPRVRGHAALSARPEFGDVSLELHGGIVFRIPRARARPSANSGWRKGAVVEPRGFEPLTSAVRLRRSPN